METWPKVYSPQDAPREVLDLAAQLIPQLLVGDHPAMAALREQYERAKVVGVELTGVGFFIKYEIPDDVPRTSPSRIAGGGAKIEATGVENSAGCVLFVDDGMLSALEVFTYTDEWPEHAEVLAIKNVFPLIHSLPR